MITPVRTIKVLIVEDSAIVRDLLVRILEGDPAIRVVHCARNGIEAIEALAHHSPDVITMDIHMPHMDGYEATRRIMETQPRPIVIVTASYDADDVSKTFRALEAGAVAFIEKPPGVCSPDHAKCAEKLVAMVKAMSEVRVVRRSSRTRPPAPPRANRPGSPARPDGIDLVAIGASTGGPPVLNAILGALPKPFPVPIVIVQHIATGFVQGLADWLTTSAGLPVHIARDGQRALPGHAHLAPDACQMRIAAGGLISCTDSVMENGLRPSVSHLFRSVAQTYGKRAAGVLLTGMGRDGADELKLMRERGAVTIAQDRESCVVNGMPGAAVQIDAAMHVCTPLEIAALLSSLVTAPAAGPSSAK